MWTEADVERNTRYGKILFGRLVVDVRAYVLDPPKRRKFRLQQLECRACYYLRSGISCAQAFTEYICANCDQPYSHPNTARPRLCQDCAKTLDLCVRCGGQRGDATLPRMMRKARASQDRDAAKVIKKAKGRS